MESKNNWLGRRCIRIEVEDRSIFASACEMSLLIVQVCTGGADGGEKAGRFCGSGSAFTSLPSLNSSSSDL